MKEKWDKPTINVEKFVANDYCKSTCYAVTCITPNNNGEFKYIYQDTNNDGRWDWGDQQLYHAGYGRIFRGDNVQEYTHTYPENNGFVVDEDGNSYPVFYFYKSEGHNNIHVADLTNPKNTEVGADISSPEHPNRS